MAPALTPRWQRALKFVGLAALIIVVAGCGLPFLIFPPLSTRISAASRDGGTLIHVVGWNGPGVAERNLLHALRDGGCPMAMETFDWTAGQRSLTALWRAQHSVAPAHDLAAHIETIWRAQPSLPISITADSSGCGVALAAVASLPPEVRIRTIVLASPALAPTYDLRPALAHVDGKLISFNSDRDFIILCVGTTIFGTVDRHHAPAAGRAGFVIPRSDAADARLWQISYNQAWASEYGNHGGHAQALSPRFARAMIAPLLVRP